MARACLNFEKAYPPPSFCRILRIPKDSYVQLAA